jgi:dihydrodipicolinate reductase
MSNEITLAKAEFKLDLDTAGVVVVDYIPERITPPVVIINTASPYLVPSTLGNEYKMNLELVVVAATATNKQASEKLDEAIEAILLAMPRYARVVSVNEPYEMATNNANYLSANISVELEITL